MGDTAGTLDNIVSCKLYRPGSVGFVSKSGGMSNEMYNVLGRTTDGLYEGELCWLAQLTLSPSLTLTLTTTQSNPTPESHAAWRRVFEQSRRVCARHEA